MTFLFPSQRSDQIKKNALASHGERPRARFVCTSYLHDTAIVSERSVIPVSWPKRNTHGAFTKALSCGSLRSKLFKAWSCGTTTRSDCAAARMPAPLDDERWLSVGIHLHQGRLTQSADSGDPVSVPGAPGLGAVPLPSETFPKQENTMSLPVPLSANPPPDSVCAPLAPEISPNRS